MTERHGGPATRRMLVDASPAVAVRGVEGGLRVRGWGKRSRPGCPLVTIVTPVLNGGSRFMASAESVFAQTYDNVEYIVADGGSHDGTVRVLEEHDDRIDYWWSARDHGIYDAINRGIAAAHGDYIAILNSDDGFHPDAIARAVTELVRQQADFCVGSVIVRDARDRPRLIAHPLADWRTEGQRPTGRMPFPHISLIVARSVYERLGPYDTSYRIAADYDFALRLLRANLRGVRIEEPCGWITEGGASERPINLIEKRSILVKAGVHPVKAHLIFASKFANRAFARMLPSGALRRVLRWRKSRVQTWSS